MVIGLTGKTCSGKDYISSLMQKKGFYIIDSDFISHQSLIKEKAKVVKAFGKEILDSEGNLDRKVLGALVFSDENKLKRLEEILKENILKECKNQINSHRSEIVVLNAPLLQRYELEIFCDLALFVYSPFITRYLRAKKRDGLSFLSFYKRNFNQKDIKLSKLRNKMRVKVFYNFSNRNKINRQVSKFCDRMKKNEGSENGKEE
ncbi:MAG: dephospho-CoA kinase [Sphaerochaetaceae bacterium]|nr:dephospho-CoA kinase [Sphaerochaetaceae bacterium]